MAVYNLDSFCLKADAGKDTTITANDSVFIGTLTNGIDSIKWYNGSGQLIDSTRPGFWVHPATTGTYMYIVQQTVNGCFSADTIYINVIVPLKIMSYELRVINDTRNGNNEKQVTSNWTTANEVNVSHFNVQRSENGKDFINVGRVKAQNKNYNQYTYTGELTRNEKQETLYYRIVGVDKDGKQTYSEVKQLTIKPPTPNNVFVYPNPAKDVVHVYCKEGIKEVRVLNTVGQQISHFVRNDSNIQHLSFNIQHYPKGLYLLTIITQHNVIYYEKLMVQ